MTITPTPHEKSEWSRVAADAYRTGRNWYGHRFSAMASLPAEAAIPARSFAILESLYFSWLVHGWAEIDQYAEKLNTVKI